MNSLTQLSDADLLARYLGEASDDDGGSEGSTADNGVASSRDARRQEAFRLLVLRHGRIVMSACRGVLRSEADAEDAFQATFFVLARKAGGVDNRANLAAWLHRVAMRIAIRAARRKQARQTQSLDAAPEPASEELRRVSTQSSLLAVHEAIARLSAPLRAAILLTYFAGLTRSEAASRLGVTDGVMQGRLKKARAELRRRLALRGTSLAAVTVLAHLTTTSAAQASLVRLTDACAQTVFSVQSGLAAAGNSAGGSLIPQTLAEGVIRTMTINTLLRHSLIAAVALVGAWLVFGAALSSGGGGAQAFAQPISELAARLEPAVPPATMFVSAASTQGGNTRNDGSGNSSGQQSDNFQDDKEEEKVTPGEAAWGKGVKGLQAAVRFKDKQKSGPFQFGDTADIEFVIRNVGNEAIEFRSCQWREDDQMFVKNLDTDEAVPVGTIWYSGFPQLKNYKLEPGDEAVLQSGSLGIGGGGKTNDDFKHATVYIPELTAGKFSGWFNLRLPDVQTGELQTGWKGILTTGNLKFEVQAKTTNDNFIK